MQSFRLPLDPTGKSARNFIPNEAHQLPARTVRAIVPHFGAFYAQDLALVETSTGRHLVRGTDYHLVDMLTIPTLEFGREAYAEILIINTQVSNAVKLSYRAVGGQYSINKTNIYNAISTLNLDDRPVGYGDIIAKPWFWSPNPHQHDTDDTYGWEYVIAPLQKLLANIARTDKPMYDKVVSDIDTYLLQIDSSIANLNTLLQQHMGNTDNPHQLTATQMNAYTKLQFDTNVNNLYTSLNNAISAIYQSLVNHINDHNNPHQDSLAQIDAYSTAEFNTLMGQTGFEQKPYYNRNQTYDNLPRYEGGGS